MKRSIMRKSIKGLLYSGLVLPGLGQIVLKRYIRGTVYMLAVMGGLIVVMVRATQTAMDIVAQMGPATNMADFNHMVAEANQAMAQVDTGGYAIALLVIVLTWIISAVDAFLLGRQLEKKG